MQYSERILPEHLIRLEKHIAKLGLASRREAKDLIVRGFVSVNGEIVTNPGYGFDIQKDTVTVKTDVEHKKEYILLYKPRGIETNKTSDHLQDIHDVFPEYSHLSPIGRLDAESEGLIILTNDGTLTKALTQQDTHIGKTYEVTVRESVSEDACATMARGIVLDGIVTKLAEVKKIDTHRFTIVLHEGRKHQIRRMADAVKLTVERLVRIAIGNIEVQEMKSSESRSLNQEEVLRLKSIG